MRPESVPRPQPIKLTAREVALLKRIDFDLTERADAEISFETVATLAHSLFERQAIPEIRLRYLMDAALNVGGRRSRLDIFRSNGIGAVEELTSHPHFLPYLRYFIFGPDLSRATIDRFRAVILDDRGTSGMVQDELRRCARAETRQLGLSRAHAAEEFFKLALECGLHLDLARSIRDAARTAR